jgi:ferrous iron transport protein B
MPCVATLGAIRRETGPRWAAFVAAWSTGVAYLCATLFYQLATVTRHPAPSLLWAGGALLLALLAFWSLRRWAERGVQVAS